MVSARDFDTARNDPSRRQAFLELLVLSEIPGCSGVWYDPDLRLVKDFVYRLSVKIGMNPEQARRQVEYMPGAQEVEHPLEAYAFVPSVPTLAGLFTDMPIFVWSRAFSGEISEEEIRHCLIAHEGTHVRQMTTGYQCFDTAAYRESFKKGQIRPVVRQLIDELDAHHQGSLQAGKFRLGPPYMRRIQKQIGSLIAGLYNAYIDSASGQERDFIKDTLKMVPHQPRLIQTGEIRRYMQQSSKK